MKKSFITSGPEDTIRLDAAQIENNRGHNIFNKIAFATSKDSDLSVYMRSLTSLRRALCQ